MKFRLHIFFFVIFILVTLCFAEFTRDSMTIGYLTLDSTFVHGSAGVLLKNNARVIKYAWIPAGGVRAAGAKPATLGVNGNGWLVQSFADGQEQQVLANIKVPDDMDISADFLCCLFQSV